MTAHYYLQVNFLIRYQVKMKSRGQTSSVHSNPRISFECWNPQITSYENKKGIDIILNISHTSRGDLRRKTEKVVVVMWLGLMELSMHENDYVTSKRSSQCRRNNTSIWIGINREIFRCRSNLHVLSKTIKSHSLPYKTLRDIFGGPPYVFYSASMYNMRSSNVKKRKLFRTHGPHGFNTQESLRNTRVLAVFKTFLW